jgi:hypothetical protein
LLKLLEGLRLGGKLRLQLTRRFIRDNGLKSLTETLDKL